MKRILKYCICDSDSVYPRSKRLFVYNTNLFYIYVTCILLYWIICTICDLYYSYDISYSKVKDLPHAWSTSIVATDLPYIWPKITNQWS